MPTENFNDKNPGSCSEAYLKKGKKSTMLAAGEPASTVSDPARSTGVHINAAKS